MTQAPNLSHERYRCYTFGSRKEGQPSRQQRCNRWFCTAV